MIKSSTFRVLLFIVLAATIIRTANAQSDSDKNKNPNKAWSISGSLGPSFLYGDMSDDANPFAKLVSDEFSMSYAVSGRKGLSNVFGLNLQALLGNTSGYRDYWSTGAPTGGFHFKNFYMEYSLFLDIDILNIFNAKDRRLINPYLKGGGAFTYFNTTVWYQGNEYGGAKKSTFAIPFGGGIRLDVSPKLGIFLDQSVSYALTDEFDGYVSQFTDKNDWYTYTSLGVTYRFLSSEKKEYNYDEEENIPEEEIVAENGVDSAEAEALPLKDFAISSDIPKEIYQGDTIVVTVKVSKGDHLVNGKAKIQQTLPAGFEATEGESQGGQFSFKNNVVTFSWNEIPAGSNFSVNYTIITLKSSPGDFTVPGIAYYTQDSVDMVKQIKNNIHVKSVAEKDQMVVVKRESKLLYRVQVQAIYGGKTSAESIKRRYGIDKDVNIDYDAGYTKYTVGGFTTYEEAKAYRDKLRNSGCPGAFVVGYYDGARIKDIKRAITIEKAGTEVMVLQAASTEADNTTYKIQIAASTTNQSTYQIQSKYGIKDKVDKMFIGGLYKYTIGNYKSYSQAKSKLQEIKRNVPDAFIIVGETK